MKICSRSLFFDPQDIQMPVMKFEFQHIERIEPANNEVCNISIGVRDFYVKIFF